MAKLIKSSISNESYLSNNPAVKTTFNYQSSASIDDQINWQSSLNNQSNTVIEQEPWNQMRSTLVFLQKQSFVFLHTVDQMEHSIDLNLSFRIIFYSIYFLIFVVGITGNVLVCYVVYRQSSMHTPTNMFIANLALSDILLCLFCVPFTPLYLLTFKEWIFGRIFCHLVAFAQGK